MYRARRLNLVMLLATAASVVLTQSGVVVGQTNGGYVPCPSCGTLCAPTHLVECTVQVPALVAETRMKPCVITKTEEKEETYTVFQRVPKTQKFTKETCYLEDEVRTKTITETKCHRVTNPVVRVYEVKVPEQEIRQGVVKKEICTRCGKVCIEEPCTCVVTVERPEIRSETCEVPDVVFEKNKREITYCVKVPKKKTVPCVEETVYELVPIEKKRKVQVCVPEVIQQPVEVLVQKMVTKKVWCCCSCRARHGL